MPAYTHLDARHCCACIHWHRTRETAGECRDPEQRWGVTYENPATHARTHVEWWSTGECCTCRRWIERPAA